MRYDDDNLLDNGEDNDLWDDELDISDQPYSRQDNYAYENVRPRTSEEDYTDNAGIPDNSHSDREIGEHIGSADDHSDDDEEDDDDEDNDYFDSDDEPVKAKPSKAPKLDPEDPDYWVDEEESLLTGIIHQTNDKWKWWLVSCLILLSLLTFGWIWFLRPHTDNAVKYGYILNMERRGSLIKTFEGRMVPYKELGDPDPLYFTKECFSVESDSLAAVMKRYMLRCVPVRVEYKEYRMPLPWKGEQQMIIVKADSADPRKILPPEYR